MLVVLLAVARERILCLVRVVEVDEWIVCANRDSIFPELIDV